MPTNTSKMPNANEVSKQPSCTKIVFMLTREDYDKEDKSFSIPEFDRTIDFITAESAEEAMAYQEELIESEGFEPDFSGSRLGIATCGSIESIYTVQSMDHPTFWEWIEEHFDECIDNLVYWAKYDEIGAAALLNSADSGETLGHRLLAQHAQFRSIAEKSILQSTSEAGGAVEPTRARTSL